MVNCEDFQSGVAGYRAGRGGRRLCGGWFLRGQASPQPVRVEVERTLVQETPIVLPSPSPEAAESDAPAAPVNINTADAETLMTLPGIGETRAADIIAYRQANGPFRMVEQLTDVPGYRRGDPGGPDRLCNRGIGGKP